MKTIYIFILFYFTVSSTMCQPVTLIKKLNNDSIKFTILKTQTKLLDSNKVSLSQEFIKVKLSDSEKRKFRKMKPAQWLILLNDDKTDWAANLCLYDLYKKDAAVFKIVRTREQWRKCCKEQDIIFWSKELNK